MYATTKIFNIYYNSICICILINGFAGNIRILVIAEMGQFLKVELKIVK